MLSQPPDRNGETNQVPLVSIWSYDDKAYFIDKAEIKISDRTKLDALIKNCNIKMPYLRLENFYEISLTCDFSILNAFRKLDFLPHPYAYDK